MIKSYHGKNKNKRTNKNQTYHGKVKKALLKKKKRLYCPVSMKSNSVSTIALWP